ncbi:putative DNA repair protein Rhp26/Rad26 [Xylona heveae TC161]|uniref:Putative DNA repair protein Rhp26/Rad26 n=1 Tax=Xylona heveae (strain CBS 132557 / TC161) TaxID=1328760 RepID=A0A165GXF0_XYLHT|nr:putative DNA repair protein Rhp26/Rad26 [Xylona heveae TC161]KZF22723.1 putative DNA repair protein Rhp26/Rad26 [Xylona heveae TC161]
MVENREQPQTPQTAADSTQTHETRHQGSSVHRDHGVDTPTTASEGTNQEVLGEDEASRLKELTANVRDQDELERDISRQADRLLLEQADERDQKRLDKSNAEKEKLLAQVRTVQQRLAQPTGVASRVRLEAELDNLQIRISGLDTDIDQIRDRIKQRHQDDGVTEANSIDESGARRLPNESRRDFLIRTGKITPFSARGRPLARSSSNLQDVMFDAEEAFSSEGEMEEVEHEDSTGKEPMSHRNLLLPGFSDEDDSQLSFESSEQDEEEVDDAFIVDERPRKRRRTDQKSKVAPGEPAKEDFAGIDDGNESVYQTRLESWVKRRRAARLRAQARKEPTESSSESAIFQGVNQAQRDDRVEDEEWYMPHPTRSDTEFEGDFRMPGDIYPSLFDYQKTGVRWLWELYSQQVGGIIGDEMGLGKTIQVISFLAGLHYSKKITKPIIVVAPATVMKQWVNEFHTWWPPLRVSILHSSGSGMIDLRQEREREFELVSQLWNGSNSMGRTKGQKTAQRVVDRVIQEGHVLVTTYSGLQTYAELLIPIDWEYAVLDEGHKIRNPNAAITIYCKELRTANRIILSGTPMQNNLTELWSLFDFVFPMRLGTLVNFRNQFEYPIRQGGYANASNLQVQTAMKCAETLKETISAYLLQRFKIDVAADLPKKSEQVLFCKLTKSQREAYETFLASDDMKAIMNRKRQVLYGVDILRKICNHPDLQEHKTLSLKGNYAYGNSAKSGKMQVVKALLGLWKETGHKTLLFAQHRIMLDILESFVKSLGGFNYRRMDGNTPIQTRQSLVDEFNKTPDIHVFLLTTKVGGLGVNLTGADRVIIFDPDWNPSTDLQARERAWRLGQKREVMIYRLMTAGTIEEKIYHRQIFKQFLTNKILKDPKQRQTFQMSDLHDLFTLGTNEQEPTETSKLFQGTEVKFGGGGRDTGKSRAQGSPPSSAGPADADNKDNPDDLRRMAGVASMERYHGEEEEEQKASDPAKANEDRVMEGIFSRAGVHSALEHDQIINGKRVIAADPKIIEREAKRVAAEAARELQKAGEEAKQVPIGTPTWTGEFGTAGRPQGPVGFGRGRGRGGPSSASILAGLQDRQLADRDSSSSRAGTPSGRNSRPGTPAPRGKDFIRMIRDYLLVHGGQVYTQMLVDHFNRYCTTPAQTMEFKEMLKQIAVLEKGSRGRAKWILKDEYKRRP